MFTMEHHQYHGEKVLLQNQPKWDFLLLLQEETELPLLHSDGLVFSPDTPLEGEFGTSIPHPIQGQLSLHLRMTCESIIRTCI